MLALFQAASVAVLVVLVADMVADPDLAVVAALVVSHALPLATSVVVQTITRVIARPKQ